MSKLVLLINEPRICAGCQFCESEYIGEGINKKYATSHYRLNRYEIKELKERPGWCLLRLLNPLPEKKEYIVPIDNVESQKDIIAVGWNTCLREITETSDENER